MESIEKVKKGLECCKSSPTCSLCPYYNEDDCNVMERDALACIRQLEHDNAELKESLDYTDAANTELHSALENAQRERDALLDVIRGDCCICANYKECVENDFTIERNYPSCWQWRGVQEG